MPAGERSFQRGGSEPAGPYSRMESKPALDCGAIYAQGEAERRARLPAALYALDDKGPVTGAFEAMLACLAVGGAVVPCFGRLKGRKLEHDRSFDWGTLQHLVPAVGNSRRDRMAGQRCRGDLGISLKLFGIPSTVANENCVSWH